MRSLHLYCTNSIYFNTGINVAKNLLEGFFRKYGGYQIDSPNEDFRSLFSNGIIWSDRDYDSDFIWIAARNWYDYSPSPDIIIRLHNYRKAIQQKYLEDKVIPPNIRRQFANYPNCIELEGHYIFYHFDLLYLAIGILQMLNKNKIKTLMMNLEEEVFKIKNDPSLPLEDRLMRIHHISSHIADNIHNDRRLRTLQHLLLYKWDSLEEQSQKYLLTAEYYYEVAEKCGSHILDFSPAIIEYSKAIEYEIASKILFPFKDWVQKKYKGKDLSKIYSSGSKDRKLSRLATFVISPDNKSLELGTYAYVMNEIRKWESTGVKNQLVNDFLDFISGSSNPDYLLSTEWLNGVKRITKKYRNLAAHKEPLSSKFVSELRTLLFKENLLKKFLAAI